MRNFLSVWKQFRLNLSRNHKMWKNKNPANNKKWSNLKRYILYFEREMEKGNWISKNIYFPRTVIILFFFFSVKKKFFCEKNWKIVKDYPKHTYCRLLLHASLFKFILLPFTSFLLRTFSFDISNFESLITFMIYMSIFFWCKIT